MPMCAPAGFSLGSTRSSCQTIRRPESSTATTPTSFPPASAADSATPPKVAIDESLELAKRYGSAQSSQFVNGILDRLMPPEKINDLRETESDRPSAGSSF